VATRAQDIVRFTNCRELGLIAYHLFVTVFLRGFFPLYMYLVCVGVTRTASRHRLLSLIVSVAFSLIVRLLLASIYNYIA